MKEPKIQKLKSELNEVQVKINNLKIYYEKGDHDLAHQIDDLIDDSIKIEEEIKELESK